MLRLPPHLKRGPSPAALPLTLDMLTVSEIANDGVAHATAPLLSSSLRHDLRESEGHSIIID